MLTDGDYICRMIQLPGDINAVLRIDPDGFGTIYINDQLSPMARRRAFDHECQHLREDDMYNGFSIREVEG